MIGTIVSSELGGSPPRLRGGWQGLSVRARKREESASVGLCPSDAMRKGMPKIGGVGDLEMSLKGRSGDGYR